MERPCGRRNGDGGETDPRFSGADWDASGCSDRSSTTAAVHDSHLYIGRLGFWILSLYDHHPVASTLDEAGATSGTTRWIADRNISSSRRHATVLNIFSGAGHESDDVVLEMVKVDPEALNDLGPHALAFANHAKKKVLGADVAVAALQRLSKGQLEHLLRSGGERW